MVESVRIQLLQKQVHSRELYSSRIYVSNIVRVYKELDSLEGITLFVSRRRDLISRNVVASKPEPREGVAV
jgi:hypothetical protein